MKVSLQRQERRREEYEVVLVNSSVQSKSILVAYKKFIGKLKYFYKVLLELRAKRSDEVIAVEFSRLVYVETNKV